MKNRAALDVSRFTAVMLSLLLMCLLSIPSLAFAQTTTSSLELITISTDGSSGSDGDSRNPKISTDGTALAFDSASTNLVAPASNGNGNIFVKSLSIAGSSNRLLTPGPLGIGGNGASQNVKVSGDGRYVVFESLASDLGAENLPLGDTNGVSDVFLCEVSTGKIWCLSVTDIGDQANGASVDAAISDDGSTIAFASSATNLDPASGPVVDKAVYVRSFASGTLGPLSCASVNAAGQKSNQGCFRPALSPGGMKVAFDSTATDLVAGHTGAAADVFMCDVATPSPTMQCISLNWDGTQAIRPSTKPTFSSDGTRLAFESEASGLVQGLIDVNGYSDVFIRNLQAGTTACASVIPSGAQTGNDISYSVTLSSDGRYVAFVSSATDLTTDVALNGRRQAFVRDMTNGVLTCVSVNATGVVADYHSDYPSVSGDGKMVAFDSWAENLIINPPAGALAWEVYLWQLSTTFDVAFDSLGGSPVAPLTGVADGSTILAPVPPPTKEGYSFGGWYKDAGCTVPWDFAADTVSADTTLYAKWNTPTPPTPGPTPLPTPSQPGGLAPTGDGIEVMGLVFLVAAGLGGLLLAHAFRRRSV